MSPKLCFAAPRHNEASKYQSRIWNQGFSALKLMLILAVLVVIAAIAVALGGVLVYQHVTEPGVPGETVKVTIPDGVSGKEVGRILVQNGLIEHELFFRLAVKLDKTHKPIKHGWYSLAKGSSAMQLLHVLQQGSNRTPDVSEIPPELRVTVPEGLSIAQASQFFANPRTFVEAASDPALISRLHIKAQTLEGFLMPDTYYFDKKPTEREVVERMVTQFEKKYAEVSAGSTPPQGFDTLAIVTIASLVEGEAKVPEERLKVAAVIYNRLEKKMPLQLDSTVQFVLNKRGQRVLHEDLEIDSPYNTYKNPGLPPGPICSPGVAALKAALHPAPEKYLYFVSNADGQTHTFSVTEAEHLKAVARFRKEIEPQREALEKKKKKGE